MVKIFWIKMAILDLPLKRVWIMRIKYNKDMIYVAEYTYCH
jgi:hypothetical protein